MLSWRTIIRSSLIQKASVLGGIWQLRLILKIKIFAWKLIQKKLLPRYKMRKIGFNIDVDCPLCHR